MLNSFNYIKDVLNQKPVTLISSVHRSTDIFLCRIVSKIFNFRYRDGLKKTRKKLKEYQHKESEQKQLRWKDRTEEQIINDQAK